MPIHAGHSNRWRSSSPLALRHGSTGATAIRNSRAMAMGMVIRLKYGEPTEIWLPFTASMINGKTVPSSTTTVSYTHLTLPTILRV